MTLITNQEIKYIDLRFTDTKGKEHHLSIPKSAFQTNKFKDGQAFDGSSIAGWRSIEKSDMLLIPDPTSAFIDPFFEEKTLVLSCDVYDPFLSKPYNRDPRSIAKRAETYLKESGIGDTAFFGPEPEFFIFDQLHLNTSPMHMGFHIQAYELPNSQDKTFTQGNLGHRPIAKGGYFPVPPVDDLHHIRSKMCSYLEAVGIPVEVHHHEVASAQCEIGTRFSTLVERADWVQRLKYIVHNTAAQYQKTATFMPKPIIGDNGSGMHCHQSVWRDGVNLFAGNEYAGLSKFALHYIGGIIHHARALNAITNPSTNSYKRLVPGYEAPVMLAYSSCNRSASIRIPFVASPNAKRIEARFPDPMANPYLAFSAMLMAGLDGVRRQIDPGKPSDQNLYIDSEKNKIPTVSHSLEMSLDALANDHSFLLEGDVFNQDMIQAYIDLKREEVMRIQNTPHPLEFEMYYSL
jgi:3-(hydroxyamino)phenol mutase